MWSDGGIKDMYEQDKCVICCLYNRQSRSACMVCGIFNNNPRFLNHVSPKTFQTDGHTKEQKLQSSFAYIN